MQQVEMEQERGSYALSYFQWDIPCAIAEDYMNVANTGKYVAFNKGEVFAVLYTYMISPMTVIIVTTNDTQTRLAT